MSNMSNVHSPCADSVGTGAPAEEIEVTPAMIEAGADALRDVLCVVELPPEFSADELAVSVYRAMDCLRPVPADGTTCVRHKP